MEFIGFMNMLNLVDDAVLAAHAAAADVEQSWPTASWQELCRAGVPGWCIPQEDGGQGLHGVELLEKYESLAAACLTTCFILSQRDAACRRICDSANEVLRRELLPPLASGERFATVGLSQLTTSRQHVQPTLLARTVGDAFHLDGTIPWITGAAQADHFIIGAVLDDGRQVLAALPRDTVGVRVGPPLDLMALQGSLTAEVQCREVVLERRWLLAGPAERVLTIGRGGAGGLETSCLALGLTRAATTYLEQESRARPELRTIVERLEQARQSLRDEMHDLARGSPAPDRATALRGRVNALVLQATQAALTASKGSGFVRPHPAQRWARQALFFLVWSCPRPAAEATLAHLTPSAEPTCP
jgi:butyryl-CoA dehydrogenase